MLDSVHLRSGGERIRVTDFVFKKSDVFFKKTVDDTIESPRFLTPAEKRTRSSASVLYAPRA
jgi:hypothetical protein